MTEKNSENLEVLKEMSQHILEEIHPIYTHSKISQSQISKEMSRKEF